MVKVLTLEGYDTPEAADGQSALALAHRERPDLIVMDLAMPGMDGWEASRRLKADPQTADIPIIALTAFALGTRSALTRWDAMGIYRNLAGPEPSVRSSRASSPAAEWSRRR